MTESDRLDAGGHSADLRTRIAAVHQAHRWGVFRCSDGYARTCCRCQWREKPDGPTHAEHVADAVIRELDGQLIDFALWLSEELRGEPLSRIDAESCLQEWKWLNDESRWLKGDDDD